MASSLRAAAQALTSRCILLAQSPPVLALNQNGRRQLIRGVMASKRRRRSVSRPREGKDLTPLPDRHLGDDVSGRAEAIDAQSSAAAGLLEAAPADQPRA